MYKDDTVDCVGPGWRPAVQKLIDYCLANHIEILQIKEKFGWLRFYYKGRNEELDRLISAAEEETEKLCEWCGEEGRRRANGWVKTLCDTHDTSWQEGKRWWD
jgi:hypothetical protein